MTDRLKLVAFDLDGTLLDSISSIIEGVRACWSALGFPEADPEQIKRIIGLPWERGVEILLPGAGEREVAMVQKYHAEIARGDREPPDRPPETMFPGVSSLLDSLEADGYLLAIVTSRSNRRILELVGGLEGRFVSVQTADRGPGKPNPFLLDSAMREAGVDTEDTVMVGDTVYDVQTALNAGTGAIGVTWGVHPAEDLRSAGAHRVASSFDQLRSGIDDLLRSDA